MGKKITEQKSHGVHFTPQPLACFLARRIITSSDFHSKKKIRVLDPACGDGELLIAFADTIPAEHLQKISFVGIDSNEESLRMAQQRLENRAIKATEFVQADFLEMSRPKKVQPTLFDKLNSSPVLNEPFDIIIANPPYVRTQVLGAQRAQELAEAFDLRGRVDLYHAFLVAMTRSIIPGGILGVITSNRFLSTRGGASTRELLASKYDILEIFDLGDTKLFQAAVLPAIFVGRKRDQTFSGDQAVYNKGRFVRIYQQRDEDTNTSSVPRKMDSVYSVLDQSGDGEYLIAEQRYKVTTGILSLPLSLDEPWCMTTSKESAWIDIIHANMKFRIGDIAKVRVGVKTTADDVFIRDNWDNLVDSSLPVPEKHTLHLLLSQDQSRRWAIDEGRLSRRILYTHIIKNGKRMAIDLADYPHASAYLEHHRERLESRKYILEAKRQWYEIWVPQNPALWEQPKIVFPDISPEPKFFFDDSGCIVDGNCYWVTVSETASRDLLYLIMGVANSKLMTTYHDLVFNNKLYGGRRRYLTQYVEKYPMPDPSTEPSRKIIQIVQELILTSDEEIQSRKEKDLEALVVQAFGSRYFSSFLEKNVLSSMAEGVSV